MEIKSTLIDRQGYKFKVRVASFFQGLRESVRVFRFPDSGYDIETSKLIWLVRLRWLAIATFFVLSGPAFVVGSLSRASLPQYIGIVGILIVFNLITQLIVSEGKRPISPLWICFHMTIDLIALTLLVGLTGGLANPLIALFLLNAALGAILISSRLSWSFLFLVHTFVLLLQARYLLSSENVTPSFLIIAFVLSHFLIASFYLVMRSLGIHLELQYASQIEAQTRLEKQDRLRAVGALSAGFSHEFASPLNTAKLRLERFLKNQKEISEDISEALEAVLTCEAVVKQMNSSQLDGRDLDAKSINIAELMEDVLSTWQEENPTADVKKHLQPHIVSSVPPINFAQVLLNLLDNAYEEKPEGQIELRLNTEKGQVCISVSDQGQGFSKAVLDRRGEPFNTTKKSGTGLGLYVSELFCLSMGGSLSLVNKENPTGAIVTLKWPEERLRI